MLGLVALVASGCTPRARLCTATTDCASGSACVAGRCQPDRPGTKPSIEAARRLVFRPVDVGYVRRGARGGGEEEEGVPAQVALGRDGAVLLLRFEAAVPSTAKVVEAYLVLHRSTVVDDDPAPTFLHGTRIVEAWSGRSVTQARQPKLDDVGAPETVVEPSAPALVRLDVREIVRLWQRRDPTDQGIAVVARGEGSTGTTFALAEGRQSGVERGAGPEPSGPAGIRGADGHGQAASVEPYLELYVR